MTTLTRNVKRVVVSAHHTPLVVTLAPEGIWIREPRRRIAYLMPYGVCFLEAVRMHLATERKRKAAEKKARRATQ